ncbi:hypothetical protein ACFLXQ_00680 [Chloroflexota bacterium]
MVLSVTRKASIGVLQWIGEKLSSKKTLNLSSLPVLFLGLIFLTAPIIDGWSEIFFPGGSSWFLIYLVTGLLLVTSILVTGVLYVASFVANLIVKRSIWYLVYLFPIILLLCAWYLLYPPGVTDTDIRINSFQLGAQTRVLWAGGSSKVRQGAVDLLENRSLTVPSQSEWPRSIRALGGIRLQFTGNQTVKVILPKRRFFFDGDEFGYFIMVDDGAEPYIRGSHGGGYRLWKISDGIYLYEVW